MPGNMTVILAQRLLEQVLRTEPVYGGLFPSSVTPDDLDLGDASGEVTIPRQRIFFDVPSLGVTQNVGSIRWMSVPAIDLAYVGIFDARSGGSLLIWLPLSMVKQIPYGGVVAVRSGALLLSLS